MASILIILFPFFLCAWCIHVCVHISHVYGHTYRHKQAGAWCSGSFSCSPLNPWGRVSQREPELENLASLPSHFWESHFLLWGLGFQEGCCAYSAMTWVSENLNSGPHACMVSTLTMRKLSRPPSPDRYFLMGIKLRKWPLGWVLGPPQTRLCSLFIDHIFCSFFKWQI